VVNWIKAGGNLTDAAINNRPEIYFMKNQITKYEYTEKIIGSKYNPQLGIIAGGKWGSPSPGLNVDPDFNYYIKANLVIPIFHWGQKNEEIMSAREQTEASRLQMQQTKEQVTLEVESSYYKLERSQEQMDFARGSLNNAAKNVSLMLDRYNEGLSSVLEVLDAQLYWQKTYMNYILAKYELNTAYSQYLYAVGAFSQLSK
jgi:outer membrane protein TolC